MAAAAGLSRVSRAGQHQVVLRGRSRQNRGGKHLGCADPAAGITTAAPTAVAGVAVDITSLAPSWEEAFGLFGPDALGVLTFAVYAQPQGKRDGAEGLLRGPPLRGAGR